MIAALVRRAAEAATVVFHAYAGAPVAHLTAAAGLAIAQRAALAAFAAAAGHVRVVGRALHLVVPLDRFLAACGPVALVPDAHAADAFDVLGCQARRARGVELDRGAALADAFTADAALSSLTQVALGLLVHHAVAIVVLAVADLVGAELLPLAHLLAVDAHELAGLADAHVVAAGLQGVGALVDPLVAVVVQAVADLLGDLAAGAADVEQALVDQPVAVIVHAVAIGLVGLGAFGLVGDAFGQVAELGDALIGDAVAVVVDLVADLLRRLRVGDDLAQGRG